MFFFFFLLTHMNYENGELKDNPTAILEEYPGQFFSRARPGVAAAANQRRAIEFAVVRNFCCSFADHSFIHWFILLFVCLLVIRLFVRCSNSIFARSQYHRFCFSDINTLAGNRLQLSKVSFCVLFVIVYVCVPLNCYLVPSSVLLQCKHLQTPCISFETF